MKLNVHPLTPERWPDLEALFNAKGCSVARSSAIAHAKRHGATLLEAYPVDKPDRSNDDSMWFGAKSMYDAAGFEEVARRKPNRPVVRIRAS